MFGEEHEGPVAVDVPHGCIACNPLAPLFPAAAGAGAGAGAGADAGARAGVDAGGEPGRGAQGVGPVGGTRSGESGAGGKAEGEETCDAQQHGRENEVQGGEDGARATGAAAAAGGDVDAVMTSGDLILREYEADQPHVRVSLDAQGRAGLIITPVRHVESLVDLDDSELYEFFHTAIAAVQQEKVVCSRMVVNHGSYRNLPHLHLKVFLEEDSFEEAKRGWEGERAAMWERLMRVRPAKTAFVCKAFVRRGWCHFGDSCRNLHSNPSAQ
ncbi:hypothetical protein CLOM_g1358 [Closterium sp. NIES-68]|nr:hypothetical protein CLOM_g1358 [Closterium sp. NIES-68]